MKCDIMAIGAHPDDIELGCSGTLAKHIAKGQSVVLVDLTQGELGSRGTIETRYQEAAAASAVLGASHRVNLQFQDGFFTNDQRHQLLLVQQIRKYRPGIIIGNAVRDRHPDHGRAHQLIKDAWFLSGLKKITTHGDDGEEQEAWRPRVVYHYIQDRWITPDFVVDITDTFVTKLSSIRCYATQFESSSDDPTTTYINQPGFLENIISRSRVWGHMIGVNYGEAFTVSAMIGVADLDQLLSPTLS